MINLVIKKKYLELDEPVVLVNKPVLHVPVLHVPVLHVPVRAAGVREGGGPAAVGSQGERTDMENI